MPNGVTAVQSQMEGEEDKAVPLSPNAPAQPCQPLLDAHMVNGEGARAALGPASPAPDDCDEKASECSGGTLGTGPQLPAAGGTELEAKAQERENNEDSPVEPEQLEPPEQPPKLKVEPGAGRVLCSEPGTGVGTELSLMPLAFPLLLRQLFLLGSFCQCLCWHFRNQNSEGLVAGKADVCACLVGRACFWSGQGRCCTPCV